MCRKEFGAILLSNILVSNSIYIKFVLFLILFFIILNIFLLLIKIYVFSDPNLSIIDGIENKHSEQDFKLKMIQLLLSELEWQISINSLCRSFRLLHEELGTKYNTILIQYSFLK